MRLAIHDPKVTAFNGPSPRDKRKADFSQEFPEKIEMRTGDHEPLKCQDMHPSLKVPSSGRQLYLQEADSPEEGTIHQVKPADVKIIAALGDSLTAAAGANATSFLELPTENRELSWSHLPEMTRHLVDALKKYPGISFEKDWKVVTIFIGANDLCDYCKNKTLFSADNYAYNLKVSLDLMYKELPRAIVNVVHVFWMEGLRKIDDGSPGFSPTDGSAELKELLDQNAMFQIKLEELISSGRYDKKNNFAVVLQPFLKKAQPPKHSSNQGHYHSAIGHARCMFEGGKIHGQALSVPSEKEKLHLPKTLVSGYASKMHLGKLPFKRKLVFGEVLQKLVKDLGKPIVPVIIENQPGGADHFLAARRCFREAQRYHLGKSTAFQWRLLRHVLRRNEDEVTNLNGSIDFSYFAMDCFHFSIKGHEQLASALWNNMAISEMEEPDGGHKDAAKKKLVKTLEEKGLSAEYWLPILLEQLGVTNAQALEHLSQECYQKLESYMKYVWEKNAFRKLLKLPDRKTTSEQLLKEQHDQLKKKQEQATLTLKELKQMHFGGKDRNDKLVKLKEEELRLAMEIPTNSWVPDQVSFKELITNMHKELKVMEERISKSENIPDKDVLRLASAGLALDGIYKTNKLEDLLGKREHLISIPEEFELLGPEQGPVFQQEEFSSYHAESTFTKSMEKLGFSISCSLKGGLWGFNIEASGDYSTSSVSEKRMNLHSEHAYLRTTKYNYIPLASCYFAKNQIRLSTAALQQLKDIEQLLNLTPEADKFKLIKRKCGDFFTTFGSHANQGPLHFGGIFWWNATSWGFKAHQLDEVKRFASNALNHYVGASYCGWGASVDVTRSSSDASFHSKQTEALQTEIQLCVTKTGGPAESDSLTQWKSGLMTSNKTWCLIDRGFQLVPVWSIILSSHRKDFKDAQQMSFFLMEAYKAITNQSTSLLFGEQLASAMSQAQSFLEDLKSWEVSCAEDQLMKLIKFKQELNLKTGHYTVWITMCLSDKALQDFLMKVFEAYKNVPDNTAEYIKTQMRCLLGCHVYSAENFHQYSCIMKWIYHSEKEEERICISELCQFSEVLSQVKNQIQQAVCDPRSSAEMVHEAKVKGTCTISISLYSLLKALHNTKQTDIELLLLLIANCLGYSLENATFPYLLGCPQIDFMIKKMETVHKDYLGLRDQNICRAQAFLLFTGLTIAIESEDISPEQKEERLKFMVDHMKDSLSLKVCEVLKKHQGYNDWTTLERNLCSFQDGINEAALSELHTASVLTELVDSCQKNTQQNMLTPEGMDLQSCDAEAFNHILGQELFSLFKRLELQDYYPQKLGISNFNCIAQSSLRVHESQPNSESELPFYFLQQLAMLDYRARYLVCKTESKTVLICKDTSRAKDNANSSPDSVDDFFNGDAPANRKATGTDQPSIHPMDLQMAIFHCADNFLRQYMSTKLSTCQFAIPLLVPNPCTSKIEFPLWSFRQIKKSWQYAGDLEMEVKCGDMFIWKARTPVVSFLRFSTTSSSKSLILNTLLSKHRHDIFFHRHCSGSSKKCALMKGVVDVFWYCPGGKDNSIFENCTAFTNLHGDARQHKQQVMFLNEIATVNVILLSDSDIKHEESKKILNDLLQPQKLLICLCVDRETVEPTTSRNKIKIAVKNRNEADLISELRTAIKHLLAISSSTYTLDACADIARRHGFLIDEDEPQCKSGKESAQAILDLLKENNLSDRKAQSLPLQGELWHQWCEKDKELSRLQDKKNRSIEQHRSQIESEKWALRCKQLQKAFPLTKVMSSFIKAFQLDSDTMKRYFLQFMQVFIEGLTSDHVSELREQYHRLWSKMLDKKPMGENELENELQKRLETLSSTINASLLGLEHLLREVGQVYEALDSAHEKDMRLFALPQIAADMMISGYPLELMDGDAAYVPLKWIGAILDRLVEKLGDKRLFILSVLGVQSSGKSTLLNTMFGLQLPVSAGRCTRGAFMQLIKVDELLRLDLNFDFVLVIDTEGLRTPEIASESSLNHDNELATFVIGLGNMTLINIFGENPSEMQDVLQITIQAFLRMKQIKLSPSCLFVHQNVGEITAEFKNMEGRRHLQQKLDEITLIAAQQELCDTVCFSDVIRFDVNKQVHYFAHLWEGNPPMAPPNPSYSQCVQELKQKILTMAGRDTHLMILKISDFKSRVQNLWQALLKENFVFSFKNALEISAYSKLEIKYRDWTWQLRSHLLELENKLHNQIKMGTIKSVDTVNLQDQIQKTYTNIMKELNVYFSEDKDCKILVQWKANVENKLIDLKEQLIATTVQKAKEFIRLKDSQRRLDEKKSEYEDKLFQKSKDVALLLKNEKLSEEALVDHFHHLWSKFVCEISSSVPPAKDPNISNDAEDVLLSTFKREPLIVEKIRQFKGFSINFSEHVQMKKKLVFIERTLKENDKRNIVQLKDRLVQYVHEYIDEQVQSRVDYNISYFYHIVNRVTKEVDSLSEGKTFTLTTPFKIDLLLYIFQIATERFKNMHQVFQKSNDPVMHLESKRKDFFHCFKVSCQGAACITTFAEHLCMKLEEALREAVYEKTAIKIVEEMRCNYPAFNGNRSKLETYILMSLADKENFEKYRLYIHSPQKYFKVFIDECIDDYCKEQSRLKIFLNISLDFFQSLVLSAIGRSALMVNTTNSVASLWLDTFCTALGDEVSLARSDLKAIEHQEITDTEFLKETTSKALENMVKSLKEEFANLSVQQLKSRPSEILAKLLYGCTEQCPFCKAICTNTIPDHSGDHSVCFHRPQALCGILWDKTDHFVIDICSSLVASNSLIILGNNDQILYKDYRKVGPTYANWSITPDSSALLYWKWFVCRFRSELETDYCARFDGKGEIPKEWELIEKDSMMSELRQQL
ncbi:interferon-induced very large GTPase 1-like [Microcaecilia unicolor]|uniref:Interferon-induced very large GTPase 1-like n=1 Tax=Microcaecilia unicolor TaxID=1415580 RepID=A0A6P7YXC8_9AMPH|nr:interferon-induced very large GTPase 1-like [Microcaecilia unicolor]